MQVAIVGCGLIGHKRAEALRPEDTLIGTFDLDAEAASRLAGAYGTEAYDSFDALLALGPDVVIVATSHERLAELAIQSLESGTDVLVEKPAGVSMAQVDSLLAAAQRTGRRVKVGFNHRFHPAIRRAVDEAASGDHGEVLHLRARYGHGGRPGYDREWRAQAARSGGGEIVDQGMHLIDLSHWILGELPLNAALLRTQFWDTAVDDNAVLILGEKAPRDAPWALMHVSWTEWKNMFSLEIYCRAAKLQVDGLARSSGAQTLKIHRMAAELGPPETEIVEYSADDRSWQSEWEHFCDRIADGGPLLGDLNDARYAWQIVEGAYDAGGYGAVRDGVG